MRPLATLAAALALPLAAQAQAPPAAPNPATFSMPGQVIGQVKPAAGSPAQQPRPFAPAVPQVGAGLGKTSQLENPSAKMPGMNIDLNNVVGPLPEGVLPATEKTGWQKFVEKYGTKLGLIDEQRQQNNWTPGLSRRNRERAQERVQQWWRD